MSAKTDSWDQLVAEYNRQQRRRDAWRSMSVEARRRVGGLGAWLRSSELTEEESSASVHTDWNFEPRSTGDRRANERRLGDRRLRERREQGVISGIWLGEERRRLERRSFVRRTFARRIMER